MPTIHVNPVAPQKLTMTCSAGGACPDMTLVQSSVLRLKKPNGATLTLATDTTQQSAQSLTVSHVFAPGEVDKVGTYRIYAIHTLVVGTVRGDVQAFDAIDSFQ